MPQQVIVITRAPEAKPSDVHELQRMLSVERTDTEWDVREVSNVKEL